MPIVHRVALLGFSEFERHTLASYFKLAHDRSPCYELVSVLADAEFVVADADHAPSVKLVAATERLAESVFIGSHAPAGALAWMPRPIDPLHALRELDAMVALAAAAAGQPPPPTEPPGRARPTGAAQAPRRSRAPVAALATAPARAAPALRPTALLVDDSAIATRFLETRLERWGLEIAHASNSREAVAMLAHRVYDFVFLDVELGAESELDGLALCQLIKRHGHGSAAIQSTVVMVSAHQRELDRVRGALAGCDAYLGKPLDEVELHRLMLRHGMHAQAAAPLPDPSAG